MVKIIFVKCLELHFLCRSQYFIGLSKFQRRTLVLTNYKIHCFNCQFVIAHSFEELNNAFLFVAITEVEVNWGGDILAMPIFNLFVNAASSAA